MKTGYLSIFFFLFIIFVRFESSFSAVKHHKILSDVGRNFSINCPKKHGVYGIEVEFKDEFLTKPKPYHEWQWTIYCRAFVAEGQEDKVWTNKMIIAATM